ncbi:hypothetical protein KPTHUN262_19870 [Klebsiella pneumoniae]|nr:hypothetical protein KPTHUN262_19870 [Klebsiella pneumoniae]SAX26818.1 gluconate 2-dehydrogenase%2C flavoprotein subunit [Klebsiella pneumoniae]
MATVLKKTDVAIVGFGWVGAIMAKELTEAGLNVVALERGPMRDTWPDGAYPQVIDELTYNIRRKLFQDLSKSTVTIRQTPANRRCPIASWRPSCRVPAWAAPGCTGPASISASIPLSCGCAATMKNATAKTSSPRI